MALSWDWEDTIEGQAQAAMLKHTSWHSPCLQNSTVGSSLICRFKAMSCKGGWFPSLTLALNFSINRFRKPVKRFCCMFKGLKIKGRTQSFWTALTNHSGASEAMQACSSDSKESYLEILWANVYFSKDYIVQIGLSREVLDKNAELTTALVGRLQSLKDQCMLEYIQLPHAKPLLHCLWYKVQIWRSMAWGVSKVLLFSIFWSCTS